MRFYSLFAFIIGVLLAAVSGKALALTEDLTKAVQPIYVRNSEGKLGSCTSFQAYLPSQKGSTKPQAALVTARHCIEGVVQPEVYSREFSFLPGRDIAISPYAKEIVHTFPLAKQQPKIGDQLMTMGFPSERQPKFMQCIYEGVTVFSYPEEKSTVYKKTMIYHLMTCENLESYNGFSGAPVFNPQGEVLGVFSADAQGANSKIIIFSSLIEDYSVEQIHLKQFVLPTEVQNSHAYEFSTCMDKDGFPQGVANVRLTKESTDANPKYVTDYQLSFLDAEAGPAFYLSPRLPTLSCGQEIISP